MNNVLVLPLLTMVIMGFVGGLANGLRIEKEKKLCQPEFYQKLLVGIIGGVSVPLILQLISSNVLDWVGKTDFDYQKYLVFLAYCAVGGFAGDSLLNAISNRLETMVKEAKAENEKTKNQVKNLEQALTEPEDEPQPTKGLLAPVPLNVDAKKIVDALMNGNYTMRSEQGIAKETQMSQKSVSGLLTVLERDGLVNKYVSTDKSTKWYLTAKGKTA